MDKDLLLKAVYEIESLRRQNEILHAKADVIEVFATALGMRREGGCMSEDVVWQLRRAIAEAESSEVKK